MGGLRIVATFLVLMAFGKAFNLYQNLHTLSKFLEVDVFLEKLLNFFWGKNFSEICQKSKTIPQWDIAA